ncbi:MAG: hypothetical protein FWD77_08675 [Betaproteobacteria bacterium]|nr:hypothetical protein [Betaproteobacteria bacterium]
MMNPLKRQALACAFFTGTALYAAQAAIAEEASSYVMNQGAAMARQAVADGNRGARATHLSAAHAQGIPALEASGGTPPAARKSQEMSGALSSSRHQIGYGRELPEETEFDALAGLSWQQQADGSVTALQRIRSGGALALRLGIRIAPEFNGELRFAPTSNPANAIGPFTPYDWEEMEVYWSPVVEGEDMLVEIRMPDGKMPPAGTIRFDKLTHIYELSGPGNSFSNVYPDTLPCYNEVACARTDAERRASRATAQMYFQEGADGYLCTGTLLADQSQTGTPYFYTAHHCISSQTVARTLQTSWNYQYPTCNGGAGDPPNYTVRYGGADYLNSDFSNDHSLLRLREAPPSDAIFLGWTTDSPAGGAPIVDIHHPNGDVKKISWGSMANPPSGSVTFSDGTVYPNVWKVSLTEGVTEGGSSGSGLLNCTSSDCKLIGGLIGGTTGCRTPQSEAYSKFSIAYSTALSNWLGSSTGSLPILKIVGKTSIYLGDSISSVQFRIQRSNGTSSGSTAQYAANAGTANPGIDFTPTSGTLTWGAGQVEKTVTVPFVSAKRASNDRYFDFVLSNPSSAMVDPASGKVRVTLLATGETTANRLFKWAEKIFPDLFRPSTAQTQNLDGSLLYRYYSGTGNYLGAQNSHVYFLGAGGSAILDLGPYDDWMAQVIQAGY